MYASKWAVSIYKPDYSAAIVLSLYTGRRIFLNRVAVEVWRMLEEGHELNEVCEEVAARCGISSKQMLRDMTQVIQLLKHHALLVPGPPIGMVRASSDMPSSLYTNVSKAEDHALSFRSEARWYHYAAVFAGFLGMCLLIRLPFRWWLALLQWARQRQPGSATAELVRKLLKASSRVSRYFPGRIACLERSVAIFIAGFLLGRAPTWCLGSAFDTVRHHAWLEVDGLPVGEAIRMGTKPFGVHIRI